MALTGSLREVEPADVLQLIAMGRKTGVLTIVTRQDRAQVYFKDGQPVHAVCGAATGEEAVFHLLSRSEGDFSFEAAPIDCPLTISADMQRLMLEGARRLDHIRRLKDALPPLDAVLGLGTESQSDKLGAAERAILALADGKRTVAELLSGSGLPEMAAHEALHRLVSEGWLVPQQPETAGAVAELRQQHLEPAEAPAAGSAPSPEQIQRLMQRVMSL